MRIKKVEAFKKLSLKQRHHFDMKEGFDNDFKHEGKKKAEIQLLVEFYDNVTDDVKRILAKGFEKNIVELFKQEQFPIQEDWLRRDKSLILELNPMLERLLSLV